MSSIAPATVLDVEDAITSRHSIRAFLPKPVPRELLERVLAVASRAPSGTNTQPWNVYVLTGAAKEGCRSSVLAAYDDPEERETHTEEYAYYPTDGSRRSSTGGARSAGTCTACSASPRPTRRGCTRQHSRNYEFFGAPVGLMFTIDRIMRQGSWLDFGMFLQSVMVAARGLGLDTCPQAAWTPFHRIVMPAIGAPANQQLVCGMSLGYRDPDAIENTLVTEREPVASFVKFIE